MKDGLPLLSLSLFIAVTTAGCVAPAPEHGSDTDQTQAARVEAPNQTDGEPEEPENATVSGGLGGPSGVGKLGGLGEQGGSGRPAKPGKPDEHVPEPADRDAGHGIGNTEETAAGGMASTDETGSTDARDDAIPPAASTATASATRRQN